MRSSRAWLLTIVAGVGLAGAFTPRQATAQAIAFTPTIGTAPDGVGMSVTPVVSADRRYVRLSISAGFSTVDRFQNLNIPLGAVAGGPGAGGGMGGGAIVGGGGMGGGGGAGFGGGFPSFGLPMGMDGPVASSSIPGWGPVACPNPGIMGPYGSPAGYMPYGDSLMNGNLEATSPTPAPRRAKSKATRNKRLKPKSTTPAPQAARPAVSAQPAQ